jgi:hypothetical protein
MFLAVCDVFVEARTLEVVSPEELREDARVRVDCMFINLFTNHIIMCMPSSVGVRDISYQYVLFFISQP